MRLVKMFLILVTMVSQQRLQAQSCAGGHDAFLANVSASLSEAERTNTICEDVGLEYVMKNWGGIQKQQFRAVTAALQDCFQSNSNLISLNNCLNVLLRRFITRDDGLTYKGACHLKAGATTPYSRAVQKIYASAMEKMGDVCSGGGSSGGGSGGGSWSGGGSGGGNAPGSKR
jgi:hypothetical protein